MRGHGCKKCSKSKGEIKISNILNKLGVFFEEQKRFKKCRRKLPLPFDFYLSENNSIIEHDGEQHFIPKFGNEEFFKTKDSDLIKNKFCKKNNIKLLRISYMDKNIEKKIKGFLYGT